ncbi:MAG: DNA ligase [Betaproteobacteria bacterium]|nr:DNA ligase [Betaproteobacteria bacterium]
MGGMAWLPPWPTDSAARPATELAIRPAVELATEWTSGLAPADFAVSEKLDGVRAVWDGISLRFRSGRIVEAPDWFTASLPPEPLDGELWMGRGSFDRLSGVVRSHPPDDQAWRAVRYMVFDRPMAQVHFSGRYQRLQALVAQSACDWLKAVEQVAGTDARAVQQQLRAVSDGGGEGLVLHRWDAPWLPGRTGAVRKLKLQPDAEATVLAHMPGKGRYAGQTGALLLQMPEGPRFMLGSGLTDAQRAAPPPLGAQVTYRYRGFTPAGIPRFATLLRVREAE